MIHKIIHIVWISDDLYDLNSELERCFYSHDKLKDKEYDTIHIINKYWVILI